jgi:hypothetical protein
LFQREEVERQLSNIYIADDACAFQDVVADEGSSWNPED